MSTKGSNLFGAVLVLVLCSTCGSNAVEDLDASPVEGLDASPREDARAKRDGGEGGRCAVAGLYHELCMSKEDQAGTNFPSYRKFKFYDCFEQAACETQTTGDCNWTITPAIASCLLADRSTAGSLPVDFHVHWGGSGPDNFAKREEPSAVESIAYIRELPISRGFLVTSTYSPYLWRESPLEALLEENRQRADILQRLPNKARFSLLCGVDVERSDAVAFSQRCLDLPGMAGIKLRDFSIDESYQTFEALVQLVHDKHGIILAHFSRSDEFPSSESMDGYKKWTLTGQPEVTAKLFELMKRFPQATLIIAHSAFGSFVGLDGLAWLGAEFAKHPGLKRNIYLELSASLIEEGRTETPEVVRQTIDAWRRFGIDWVLHGSDYLGGYSSMMGLEQNLIQKTDLLTASEKEKILYKNAAKIR